MDAQGPIQDRRPTPQGVLPRHLQMWLMAGIALIMLTIIFLTGHAAPAPRTSAPPTAVDTPMAMADRIRSYRQQLAEDQSRQEQILAREKAQATETTRAARPDGTAPERDPIADERRRRDYQSLFADSVAFTRRVANQQPSAVPTQVATPSAPVATVTPPAASTPVAAPTAASAAPMTKATVRDENHAPGPRLRLLEGTVIEAVLTNRIDGALAGPVNGLVTNAVFAPDRQAVLIPAGARVLGNASPVQSWGESRLAVSFHRLVMPDGHTYSLDRFTGLDQIGETGLRDEVNRHYLQVFGASLAIGAISGLAQYNTRAGFDYSFGDAYRQAAGASLATSTARVLDRYLNQLPTVTIREGYRLKVYLTNDLELPAYSAVERGGLR